MSVTASDKRPASRARGGVLASAAGVLGLIVAACTPPSPPSCDNAACVESSVTAPVTSTNDCNLQFDLKDSPACVTDEQGVFVDAARGVDTNPGSRAAPFKTLTQAIAKASTAGKKRIFVCGGTYEDALYIQTRTSIFGGFDCASWAYRREPVRITPKSAKVALHIDKVAAEGQTPMMLSDLEIRAANGSIEGPIELRSSIAALVNESENVTFQRVAFFAGEGASPPVAPSGAEANVTRVDPAITLGTPRGPQCWCAAGGSTTGGRNGLPSPLGSESGPNGPDGAIGAPSYSPITDVGSAHLAIMCFFDSPERSQTTPGADAPAEPPALGALAWGALSPQGWLPARGQSGTSGKPGQGGIGGAAFADPVADSVTYGYNGGCGGCGGTGGSGGEGGGASIGLASRLSTVRLTSCTLQSSNAGNGGAGGSGGRGAAGEVPKPPRLYQRYCAGSQGGRGADGATGGGGAGGISAGIVFQGAAPTLTDTSTPFLGSAGAPGPGATAKVGAGIAGIRTEILEFVP